MTGEKWSFVETASDPYPRSEGTSSNLLKIFSGSSIRKTDWLELASDKIREPSPEMSIHQPLGAAFDTKSQKASHLSVGLQTYRFKFTPDSFLKDCSHSSFKEGTVSPRRPLRIKNVRGSLFASAALKKESKYQAPEPFLKPSMNTLEERHDLSEAQ
jgi:hypothetical protein